LLNEINANQRVIVVTLEDPIEFMHPQLKSTFSQRELGRDFFISPTVCVPPSARLRR
jgi:twitching motility protein PilT